LLAEPTVSVVDAFARAHGTEATARAYLEYLYSAEGQAIIEKHHFRAQLPQAHERGAAPGPTLVTIAELGGWEVLQPKHFAEGGLYDTMANRP
jgi:sulfate transport system substrate-binding protein